MGSSKAQTIGYKYLLSVHAVFVHGPIDLIRSLVFDGKTGYSGEWSAGEIQVNKPELFGGESREGGVSGTVEYLPGLPAQTQNSFLAARLGPLTPAFRGVAALLFKNFYWGMNPYLKSWFIRAQRIHVRSDGTEQWYDEKAAIEGVFETSTLAIFIALDVSGSMDDIVTGGVTRLQIAKDALSTSLDTIKARMEAGSGRIDIGFTAWGDGHDDRTYLNADEDDIEDLRAFINGLLADGTATDFSQGATPALAFFNTLNSAGAYGRRVMFFLTDGGATGTTDDAAAAICADMLDRTGAFGGDDADVDMYGVNIGPGGTGDTAKMDNTGSGIDTVVDGDSETLSNIIDGALGSYVNDMNPAHIIRECLTDSNWGMGYNEADIDDVSFEAAADTLFNEKMGMSLLWDRQIPLEDFIKEVLRHIDATLFVASKGDRAGKFVLKLIRNDYDIGDLIVLDETNVVSVDGWKQTLIGEMVNSITVNFWDPMRSDTGSVTINDPALVLQQGGVVNTAQRYEGFTNPVLASRVAERDLRALSQPLYVGTIVAQWDPAAELELGDAFVLSFPILNIETIVLRVVSITRGNGRDHSVKIQVTQDVFSMPEVAFVVPPTTDWEDPQAPPSAAAVRKVFEMPYRELIQSVGQNEVDDLLEANDAAGYLGAVAGAENAEINAKLMVDDGSGYEELAVMDFSPYGYLVDAIDKVATLVTLENAKNLDQAANGTYAWIDDEAVLIEDIVGLDVTIKRGVMDTVPRDHDAGAAMIFGDEFLSSGQTEFVDAESVDVKILPMSGTGSLPLSAAPADEVTFDQRALRPYPPGNVQINGESYPATVDILVGVSWSHRDRLLQADQLIDQSVGDIGPEPGTTYTMRGYKIGIPAPLHTESGIVGTTASWNPAETGTFKIQLESERDGLTSWQYHEHQFEFTASLADDVMAQNILAKMEHWWPLDESAGPYFRDVHGGMDLRTFGTGTGVTYGQPSLRPGGPTCVRFTAAGGAFQWGVPKWWVDGVDVSLVGWVKFMDASYITDSRYLVCDAPTSDSTEAINRRLQWYASLTSNYMNSFWEYGVGTNYDPPAASTALDAATHFHGYTRESFGMTVSYFRDGLPDGGGAFTTAPTGGHSINNRFSIGNVQGATASSDASNTQPLRGDMQDISAYRTPLNSDEQVWMYNGGTGRDYDDLWTLSGLTRKWTPVQLRNKVVWVKADHQDNSGPSTGYLDKLANLTGMPWGRPFAADVANMIRNNITTLNGRPVLTANGTTNANGHFYFPNTEYRWKSVGGSTIIMVCRPVAAEVGVASRVMAMMTREGANGYLHALLRNTATLNDVGSGGRRVTGDTYLNYNNGAPRTGWDILGSFNNYSIAGTYLRINGAAAVGSTGMTTGVTTATDKGTGLGLGGASYGAGTVVSKNYELAEMIVIDGLLTSDEWDQVNGYLAHEWGLTANLDVAHPYKTTAPLV